MQIQISERLFLDFLQCKLKAFLNFSGRSGVKTEFDEFRDENYAEYCKRARKCLLNCDAAAISHAIASFKEMRKLYISVEAGVKICNDRHSLILDTAELASQSTSLNPVYNPIIFLPHQKISSQHKLLLAFYGSALSHEQKRDPTSGRIIFGNNLSSAKIQLASLIRTVGTKYGGNDELFAKIKSSSFNVLSAIYGQLYFPTYSNDLKSIASFWGFKWSEPNASGLTSVLWRKQWEKAHDETQKQKIIEYNNDDCLTLRVVDACLRRISGNDSAEQKTYPAKHTDELKAQKPLGIFKRNQFYYPELEQINKRAYFDYQRSKVFLRTSPEVKKSITTKIKRIKQLGYKINSEISFDVPKRCPLCNTLSPIKHTKASRIVHDLKMFKYGIKRWVIKYKSPRCLCKKCNRTFFPPTYEKISSSKYGRNLFAWVIYKNIGRLVSQNAIVEDLGETFGYRFSGSMVEEMKIKAAREYQKTTDKLLLKIMTGNLIHIDETKISAKGANNYVWAITNMEDIVYLYNATRESDMIKEKLRDFKGVLVSDFYTAYDSISCPQQKCLIHLIRDMNEDIVTSSLIEIRGIP